jgi:hypothetical protein
VINRSAFPICANDGSVVRIVASDAHHRRWEIIEMAQPSFIGSSLPPKQAAPLIALLTPKEASRLLRVSLSWLAKARMRGDGPPYMRIGRAIRYAEAALIQWMKSRQRLSTSEQ